MRHTPTFHETAFERGSRLVSLFVLAPLLLVLSLPVVIHFAHSPDYGFTVHRLVVRAVAAGGPAADSGIMAGDQVIAVDGVATARMHEFYAARAGNTALRPLTFTVRAAGGGTRTATIRPVRLSQGALIHAYSLWVAGLSFLLIGWWVLWRRRDPVARNFHFVCLIFAFFLLDIPDHGNLTYMLAKDYLRTLLQFLLPAFFLRFFLQFPSPTRRRSGRDGRFRLLLLPGWILFAASVALDAARLAAPGSPVENTLEIVSVVYSLGYFLAGLIVFARGVLSRDRPIQQTKLKVVLIGLAGGLLPFLAAMVVANVQPGSSLPHWQYLSLSLLLVPVSFALAIMRYGALDTGFVVRISLIYGLLTVLVVLSYFVIVGVVGKLLARVFAADTWPVIVVIAAGSGLVIMPLRNLVQVWIDRTFYPSRRADRRAIGELAEKLSGLIDANEAVQMIQDRLCTLYRPESLALFLPAAVPTAGFVARLRSCRHQGSAPAAAGPDEAFLATDSGLAHLLNRLRRPLFREEIEDHMFTGDSDADSLRLLTRLHIALIVPLITGNRLLGFMGFGPKVNGALYSQDDLANLRTLAVQAASLVESRQLYQASLERKRLETELEVARDIQSNLLPDGPLAGADFTVSGRNEPCRMVGGDYFDYFTLDNGDLTFAIADVSGKGIPASLMMTSVRVAFRQEAQAGVGPRELITRLNAVVTALGSQGHFICFFCGVYAPDTGLLRFCNAGMEQPVLFRPGQRFHQVLRKGGPVLGVDPQAVYREGAIALQPGDRLFLYTDGLTEEQDPQGEFFDTARLLDLVERHIAEPPDALLGTVFAQVNAFGGPERSDDRTAILLEINKL